MFSADILMVHCYPYKRGRAIMDILARFGPHKQLLSSAVIADVLDALGQPAGVLPGTIRPLNPKWKLFGRAATLSAVSVSAVPERPYDVELACVDSLRSGDVLVATTNGDQSSALWGELLSTASRAHGAVGVVTDGLTRDAAQIMAMDFPVFAAGFSPLDSKGRLDGVAFGQPIRIGSCLIRPGDWIFADIDGIVVAPVEVAEEALTRALEKVSAENRVRAELVKGRSAAEVFAEYKIL
jgi:regulator of RNase E activity RraA